MPTPDKPPMRDGARQFFAAYNITPARVLNLDDAEHGEHRHVAITMAGRTVTLDLSVQTDHLSIDVRAFTDTYDGTASGEAIGVFAIEKGRHVTFSENDTERRAHDWPAVRMPILLIETDPERD